MHGNQAFRQGFSASILVAEPCSLSNRPTLSRTAVGQDSKGLRIVTESYDLTNYTI